MQQIEILYRQCLQTVAPLENTRMRQVMGRNTASDNSREMELKVLDALQKMGEATVNDLAYRLKIKQNGIRDCLNGLYKRGEILKDNPDRWEMMIWSLKK